MSTNAVESEGKGLGDEGRELYELLVAYARQETTDPLRGLGRYLGFGAFGSVFVGVGSLLLVIGVLRVLQTETGTSFTGNWSWAPYLITMLVACLVIGVAVYGISRPGPRTRTPDQRS